MDRFTTVATYTVRHDIALYPPTHYSCREDRYLLFLTENYVALEILCHYLNDVVYSSPMDSVATGDEDGGERSLEKMEPFILFGSSFPRDKEYTQVCGLGGGGCNEPEARGAGSV